MFHVKLRRDLFVGRAELPFALSPETVVNTGHGDGTSIGDESPHLEEWIARGS